MTTNEQKENVNPALFAQIYEGFRAEIAKMTDAEKLALWREMSKALKD